jgi:hypothetical protein
MNITSWLKDTITVKSVSSRSNSGDPVFGSASSIKCRIENKHTLVRDATGREKLSDQWIVTDTQIDLSDVIWLPSESVASDSGHRPIKVASAKDKLGNVTMYEVYL